MTTGYVSPYGTSSAQRTASFFNTLNANNKGNPGYQPYLKRVDGNWRPLNNPPRDPARDAANAEKTRQWFATVAGQRQPQQQQGYYLPPPPGVSVPPRQDYTATLGALTAREIAELDNRAITSRENFNIFNAEAANTTQQLKAQNAMDMAEMARQYGRQEQTMAGSLASAGQLLNPYIAGRAMSGMVDDREANRARLRSAAVNKLSEINMAVDSATKKRNNELSAIERMRSALQAETNRLIAGSPY